MNKIKTNIERTERKGENYRREDQVKNFTMESLRKSKRKYLEDIRKRNTNDDSYFVQYEFC